ncbi:4-amino-4-deoxy-L-arabinose transferase [Sphingomonas gilva]|uniref:4-amino-4-deoxy-L-arabinose transferase n=1 Tax=Sphingomonas gilva TaxID=2305907 RepID=A0A396RN70_9SPHN|nr:4-amino-4-deoxy-L-arabinose transferase [Sphingomonas gilva]
MVNWANARPDSCVRTAPLFGLIALALILRVAAALWPNVHHPDAIFQYMEPAWRMLGGDGVISWEYRYGMRGQLLPVLIAGPMALGEWIDPGGSFAFFLPRIVAAICSLSIVWSAWTLGARVSSIHAVLAGFVGAIWFELVHFAPHTLGEPLATAAIIPAAVLLTRDAPSRRALAASGLLLGLGFLLRFQYAPAIGVLVALTCWRDPSRLPPLIAGGSIALAAGAAADLANGATPFAWLIENVRQNLINDRAAGFGVSPPSAYLGRFWAMWSVLIVPIVAAIWRGHRHAPALFWAALANLLFHSLIAHKEYRFIFLSVAILILLAALGSGDWTRRLRERGVRFVALAAALLWLGASLVLGMTGDMAAFWRDGAGSVRLFDRLRADDRVCGVALDGVPFHRSPGLNRLRPGTPLYLIDPDDPLARSDHYMPGYNRILAWAPARLPKGYSTVACEEEGGGKLCLFARAGGCDADAARPIAVNTVLRRLDR